MKNPIAFLMTLMAIAGAWYGETAWAIQPLYGVNINGVLTTEVLTSSSTTKLTATVVNTATITNALLKTGTSGVLKATDMALVLSQLGFGVDIIDASNRAVLYHLAVSGSNQIETAVLNSPVATTERTTEFISDIEFTIPMVTGTNPPVFTGPEITNWEQRFVTRPLAAIHVSGYLTTFGGGAGNAGPGATTFVGTIHLSGKRY